MAVDISYLNWFFTIGWKKYTFFWLFAGFITFMFWMDFGSMLEHNPLVAAILFSLVPTACLVGLIFHSVRIWQKYKKWTNPN